MAMDPTAVALTLVEPIYGAATDPSLWPDVLDMLARAIGSATTAFVAHTLAEGTSGRVSVGINIDPSLQRQYENYYHGVNIYFAKFPGTLSPGRLALSHEYLDDREVLESEYYNDFLKHLGGFYLLGVVIAQDADVVSTFASLRSRQSKPFSVESIELVRLILPHLQRAVRLQSTMRFIHDGCEAFNLLSFGVLIVQGDGRILHMNRYAREAFEERDGLSNLADGIATYDHKERKELKAFIRQASLAGGGSGLVVGGSVAIHRPSGKRPYILSVMPAYAPRLKFGGRKATALVFLVDPEREQQMDEGFLMGLYGLTRSQARLAVALAAGDDLNEYCETASIRRTTARTHLRLLFEKLGVKRQAELVALLKRIQVPLRDER
jgi:DNA-binding CsgD family transcriptional regulator